MQRIARRSMWRSLLVLASLLAVAVVGAACFGGGDEPTPAGTATAAPVATTTADATAASTQTLTPTALATPEPTLAPRLTEAPEPTPSQTSTPTSTPTAAPTPDPVSYRLAITLFHDNVVTNGQLDTGELALANLAVTLSNGIQAEHAGNGTYVIDNIKPSSGYTVSVEESDFDYIVLPGGSIVRATSEIPLPSLGESDVVMNVGLVRGGVQDPLRGAGTHWRPYGILDPITGPHNGIDLVAPAGTLVYAPIAGIITVADSADNLCEQGVVTTTRRVEIRTLNGDVVRVVHLGSRSRPVAGTFVTYNSVIGTVADKDTDPYSNFEDHIHVSYFSSQGDSYQRADPEDFLIKPVGLPVYEQ